MTRAARTLALLIAVGIAVGCGPGSQPGGPGRTTTPTPAGSAGPAITLPDPATARGMSLAEALDRRRSVREFLPGALRLQEVTQLLWAAQGVTSPTGGRTAPSAGALYPLEVLLVAGAVEGLAPGVYRYDPGRHALVATLAGDVRDQLADAALGQQAVRAASVSLVIAGVYARTTGRYGDRGIRFVDMEAGHAAQNVCLQATASGLGTVTIGAVTEEAVRAAVGLAAGETPLYVLPVGRA